MKKITAILLILIMTVSAVSCGRDTAENTMENMTGQKEAARIARYETEVPGDYAWFDYTAAALAYDSLLFGKGTEENLDIPFTPLLWKDETNSTFGFAAYVGDGRNGSDGAQEGVATIAAVLSGTLMGIDKTNQDGNNYVEQLHAYFSEEEQIILNNPGGNSQSVSMWYMLYPTILFAKVSEQYPRETLIREDILAAMDSWYEAYRIMKSTGTFEYTGFDFTAMQPYENGIWKEPDCAAGIAVLLYSGYGMTGKEEYLEAAQDCLSYVDGFAGSSLYEVLLYFAPALAAEMNAKYGTDYDIDNLLGDVLNGSSIPRGGWGSIAGKWGELSMNGLMGSTTDGGGYAFSMNTFAGAYALAALAKYDTRYARAMGIWYLNAASSSRYFFPGQTAQENQSASLNEDTRKFLEMSGDSIPYEGIRKSSNSKTPWIGGDPTVYGWAETDLSLYSGAHTGMFAAAAEPVDVEQILKIDCNAASAAGEYAVYLLYNPYEEARTVTYELPEGTWDLFDSVKKQIAVKEAEGSVKLEIPAKEAVVITELPTGLEIVHENGTYMAGERWIASDTVTADIAGYKNNDTVKGKVTLDVHVTCTDEENTVDEIILTIDEERFTFPAGEKVRFQTGDFASGSRNVQVEVRMSDGMSDSTSIRLNFEQ